MARALRWKERLLGLRESRVIFDKIDSITSAFHFKIAQAYINPKHLSLVEDQSKVTRGCRRSNRLPSHRPLDQDCLSREPEAFSNKESKASLIASSLDKINVVSSAYWEIGYTNKDTPGRHKPVIWGLHRMLTAITSATATYKVGHTSGQRKRKSGDTINNGSALNVWIKKIDPPQKGHWKPILPRAACIRPHFTRRTNWLKGHQSETRRKPYHGHQHRFLL